MTDNKINDTRLLDSVIMSFIAAAEDEDDFENASLIRDAWCRMKGGGLEPAFVIKLRLNDEARNSSYTTWEIAKLLKGLSRTMEDTERVPTMMRLRNDKGEEVGFAGIRAEL